MPSIVQRVADAIRWRLQVAETRLPPAARAHIAALRTRTRVKRGEINFDRDRLVRTFTESWKLLLAEEPGEQLGDYLEFGVFYGSSLSCVYEATRRLKLDHVRLFGFDSFEGLPDSAAAEDEGVWYPGQFRSSIQLTREFLAREGVPEERVTLLKGWFSETAVPATAEHHAIRRASVIMIDCDLYSSTVEALAFVEPLIGDRAVFVFDDWNAMGLAERNKGARPAFEELLARNPDLHAEALPDLQYKAKGDPRIFIVRRR